VEVVSTKMMSQQRFNKLAVVEKMRSAMSSNSARRKSIAVSAV